jgi:hypothetical protein
MTEQVRKERRRAIFFEPLQLPPGQYLGLSLNVDGGLGPEQSGKQQTFVNTELCKNVIQGKMD